MRPACSAEQHRRQREQRQQHAHRPGAVALAQRLQRRRQAQPGHRRRAGRAGRRSAPPARGPTPAPAARLGSAQPLGRRPRRRRRAPGPAAAAARARRAAPRRRAAARAIARVRVSAWSIVLLASSSFLRVLASTSPNLPNSVLTAPSTSQTSAERLSSASVRKPICRLFSSGQQRRRPGQHDLVLALQRLDQAGPAQRLGVQALGGHEQDREVGGVRRREVLVADRPGLERAAASRSPWPPASIAAGVGALLRVEQALVVLARELGIDRQPQRRAVAGARARQAHRELDPLVAARHGGDVGRVLLGREHLLEQRRPAAPRRTRRAS